MFAQDLSGKVDLWGFENGLMVFKDRSLGACLELAPLDVGVATDDRIIEIKLGLRTFLNSLPVGVSVQIMQEVVSGNHRRIEAHAETLCADALPLVTEITKARVKKYMDLDEAGLLPKRNVFLFLRKPFAASSAPSGFFKKAAVLTQDTLVTETASFQNVIEAVIENLKSVGIQASRKDDSDTFSLLYNQWNPDRPAPSLLTSSHDVRDQMILTDAVIGIDHFLLGRMHHKVISLKLLPEVTFASMAEALSALPFDSRLYVTAEVLDQQKEMSSLQTQRRLAYSSAAGKKGVADLESQAKLRDIESLLEEMIQGSERVFRFSLNVCLRSVALEDLESQVAETLTLIRSLSGAEGMLETYGSFDIFCDFAMPRARIKERAIKVNTSVLADFLPVFGEWEGHEVPQILLRQRSGGIFGFDPFSRELTNNNQIVSGGSGAGKSFLVGLLLAQILKARPRIFILDVGSSYRRLVENLNGQYIELGVGNHLSINPLSKAGIREGDSEALDYKTKFIVSIVEIMTKEGGRSNLGRLERAEVEKCVQRILAAPEEKTLSDLKNELLEHPEKEIQRIGRILSLWCGNAPYGKFVDRPTSVRLESEIICFDLKGLESHPDLQSVCLFLMTDLIWREVQKDRTQMKVTVFDECWKLLESPEGADFIGGVFRTYRKYRASAVAISQTIDDFAKSSVAPAIMANSSVKWLLRQKGAEPDSLKRALQLNDREMELINGLHSEKGKYSDAFLMAEDRRQLVRIESTPLEYWLVTTDPKDLSLMKEESARNPSLTGLDLLKHLAVKAPLGASFLAVS